jgi:hypothetical protein
MWTKLSDAYWSNPRIEKLSGEAGFAYSRMLSYCARHSDGEVPEGIANYIAKGNLSALEELADAGLLKKHEEGWVIPNYLKYNVSQAQWRNKQEKDAERQRRHRQGVTNGNGHKKDATEVIKEAVEDVPVF